MARAGPAGYRAVARLGMPLAEQLVNGQARVQPAAPKGGDNAVGVPPLHQSVGVLQQEQFVADVVQVDHRWERDTPVRNALPFPGLPNSMTAALKL